MVNNGEIIVHNMVNNGEFIISSLCPFGKNRVAELWYTIYHQFPVVIRGKQSPLLVNQPMGKGDLSVGKCPELKHHPTMKRRSYDISSPTDMSFGETNPQYLGHVPTP